MNKDTAIQQVIDNNPIGYAHLKKFALDWIRRREKSFTSEDLRIEYRNSFGEAPNLNLYGAVTRSLSRSKLIAYICHETAKLPDSHGRSIKKWKSLDYRRTSLEVDYGLFAEAS